jgi:hypothetical protein
MPGCICMSVACVLMYVYVYVHVRMYVCSSMSYAKHMRAYQRFSFPLYAHAQLWARKQTCEHM